MIRILTFSLILLLLSNACQKEESGFTNHAFNSTVSAKLNGEYWFASGIGNRIYNRKDSFNISLLHHKNGILQEALVLSRIPKKIGKHIIMDLDSAWGESIPSVAGLTAYLEDGDVIGEAWGSTVDTLYNYCIIDRLDTLNKIIEGRFQLMLVKNPERDFFDTPDTLRFEDGKFSAALRY